MQRRQSNVLPSYRGYDKHANNTHPSAAQEHHLPGIPGTVRSVEYVGFRTWIGSPPGATVIVALSTPFSPRNSSSRRGMAAVDQHRVCIVLGDGNLKANTHRICGCWVCVMDSWWWVGWAVYFALSRCLLQRRKVDTWFLARCRDVHFFGGSCQKQVYPFEAKNRYIIKSS